MELTSDHPFWSVRNGLPASFPKLDRDLQCDVVVVGGGITGALAAFYFADAGVRTVLVDKRDIGTGSTSASTGLLQYEVDVPLRELQRRIGVQAANRSYELCAEAVVKLGLLIGKLKIDCGHARVPSLFLARKREEIVGLQEECRLRRQLGLQLEFWAASDIRRHYPFSRPAALFSELGSSVDPHRLTHGLLLAGKRRGLKVFDRTPVARFEPTRLGIKLATKEGFTIRARRAVVACGFESLPFLRGEAGRLKSTYALVSEPIRHWQGWHRHSLIWETGMPYLYLRLTPDHRIIVGGADEDFANPRRRDALLPRKTAKLVRQCRSLFPDVPLDVAYSWAGTFGETKDGIAYIGKNRGLPHAYFALGYGGNGITYGLIAAEIIRDDFLDRKNTDARIFRFDR